MCATDFGDILDEWNAQRESRRKQKNKQQTAEFEKMIDQYLPDVGVHSQKDGLRSEDKQEQAADRARLKQMAPQATLDLHGCRIGEAVDRLERFLKTSRAQGLQKVLIIHGKGNHSAEGSVLDRVVRNHLERSAISGEFGLADKKRGGRGATWVILR